MVQCSCQPRFQRTRLPAQILLGFGIAAEVGDTSEDTQILTAVIIRHRDHTLDYAHQHARSFHEPWRHSPRRRRHTGDLFGQLQYFDKRVYPATDEVILARAATLHGEEVPACGVVYMRPAICRLLRHYRQLARKETDEGVVRWPFVAGTVDQAGLYEDERQFRLDELLSAISCATALVRSYSLMCVPLKR